MNTVTVSAILTVGIVLIGVGFYVLIHFLTARENRHVRSPATVKPARRTPSPEWAERAYSDLAAWRAARAPERKDSPNGHL